MDDTPDHPSDHPEDGQILDPTSLGTVPETPVSQAPSLPSSAVPDYEQPVPLTPSQEHAALVAFLQGNPLSKPDEHSCINEQDMLDNIPLPDDSAPS
jgi:hypothetical protein